MKLRFLFLFLALLYGQKSFCQKDYAQLRDKIIELNPGLDINDYSRIFIVYFNFCAPSKYCGEYLLNYIEKKISDNTLIIVSDTATQQFFMLKNETREVPVTVACIPLDIQQRHDIFSVYSRHIYRRKIKQLK